MKMSCIRLSVTVMINAEDVSLQNMTYISRYSSWQELLELWGLSSDLMLIHISRLNKKRFMV